MLAGETSLVGLKAERGVEVEEVEIEGEEEEEEEEELI